MKWKLQFFNEHIIFFQNKHPSFAFLLPKAGDTGTWDTSSHTWVFRKDRGDSSALSEEADAK